MEAFVAGNKWTFAKTMPRTPHEYLLAWNARVRTDFYRFVMTIRRYGYDETYKTMLMRYYDLGEWKYWTMGEFLETTWVLNRARIFRPLRPRLENPVLFKPHNGRPMRWRRKVIP